MNVMGFSEAFESAMQVKINANPDVTIPVASPAGICLLKLVAWLDRARELKAKDATDIAYLIQSYTNIPEISAAVYEEDYMEAHDWDEAKASAMKLGRDTGAIASPSTASFLQKSLYESSEKMAQFARDMQGRGGGVNLSHREHLDIFFAAFFDEDKFL